MDWFRFHTRTLDCRKVQSLPPSLFKAWVNLLCISSLGGGVIPSSKEIAFRLRCSVGQADEWIAELVARLLIDKTESNQLVMHDWNEHQYVSDDVTARVRKHRAKRVRNVSVTPPDTDTDTEQKQTTTTAPLPPLKTQHEYPETLAVIRENDRAADPMFCLRLAHTVAQRVASQDPPWPNEKAARAVSDRILALACRESYATPGRKKNHGTGLLLTTVPNIVIGGKTNYA